MNKRIYCLEALIISISALGMLLINWRLSSGLLLGSIVGLFLFWQTAAFWNEVVDAKAATPSIGAGHFLKTYGMQGAALLIGALFPQWFNIFAIAFGLVSLKMVLFLYYLIPWKGGSK